MTPDDIEAAAKRVYDAIPMMGEYRIRRLGEIDPLFEHKTLQIPIPWESSDEDYYDHCRLIATAALNIEEDAK